MTVWGTRLPDRIRFGRGSCGRSELEPDRPAQRIVDEGVPGAGRTVGAHSVRVDLSVLSAERPFSRSAGRSCGVGKELGVPGRDMVAVAVC